MSTPIRARRPQLRVLPGALDRPADWSWFCGHCAAPYLEGQAPAPIARVCKRCGLGLLLEAPAEAIPGNDDAFLVIDSALLVQAMSRRAETLLAVSEDLAVHRPVSELLAPADTEMNSRGGLAAAVANVIGDGDCVKTAFLRPWNTFGVRMRARIAPCGPPRAALLVLDGQGNKLRAVDR